MRGRRSEGWVAGGAGWGVGGEEPGFVHHAASGVDFVADDEADDGFGAVGVLAAGGAGPHQHARRDLFDSPGGVVFQGVVAAAEVGEVVVAGGSAVGGVDGVVDVAPPDRAVAAGEAAVLVAGGEEPVQRAPGR